MTFFEGSEYGKGDFVLLDQITMDEFMSNLRLRFKEDKIYTYIGEVVVSVNPYKTLDIYGKEVVADYKGREIFERPPHIFALADAAYKTMKRKYQDSCIVISGNRNVINYFSLKNNEFSLHLVKFYFHLARLLRI